jgi:clan AA aspartic protease
MKGVVNAAREAVVKLPVRCNDCSVVCLEAVVDTGFTECLAMPQARIAELGWQYSSTTRVILADGEVANVDVYQGTVLPEGQDVVVEVLCMGRDCLIGIGLLQGNRLTMDVVAAGPVTIVPLA